MEKLKQSLKEFGLNPNHWSLVKQQTNTYRIKAKQAKGFELEGITKNENGKITWDKLTILLAT